MNPFTCFLQKIKSCLSFDSLVVFCHNKIRDNNCAVLAFFSLGLFCLYTNFVKPFLGITLFLLIAKKKKEKKEEMLRFY